MSNATLVPPTPTATGVAARTVHASKVYGAGSTAVTALDDVSVDLPEPDGPMIAVKEAGSISSETPRSALTAASPSP